jgi:NADPH:quinone reductase
VNPVDTYIRAGAYARLPPLPYVPGWDGAGQVHAVGAGASRVAAGDRVYFSGTVAGRGQGAYATRALCREDQVFALPDALTFTQGAAIGVPYATAHRALFHRGRAQPGETVLIHGASGAVGQAAVQLARQHGLTVIGTAGTEAGQHLVRELGAHHALSHHVADTPDRIMALTGGRGPDLIIEMLANVNLDQDLALLAPRGRVVVVGNRGRIEIDPRQTMGKDAAILGMSLWNATDTELLEIHQLLAPGLASGALRPAVWREFRLSEAGAAHAAVLAGGARGKVVLLTD